MKNNNQRRKNNNRSYSKTDSMTKRPIEEKNKEKYYAFFDAEYTCYMESDVSFDRSHGSEVISVGLVICDKNFNLVKTYYSPIRPIYNSRLTRYCKSLTGLTQREIDEAPSYDEVFQSLYMILQEYPVREIFTWGNDANTLSNDVEKNHKSVSRKHKKVINKLRDLTKKLTKRVFGRGIVLSLSDMKFICDMEHRTEHNALSDARDLYLITKKCVQGTYNKDKALSLQRYIERRDEYHQNRRFKRTPLHEYMVVRTEQEKKQFQNMSFQYISMLKRYFEDEQGNIPSAILALCDDIRSLNGKQAVECPKLEE
ncbi:MAG: 3'-5' exonuclease [Anaerobutyricum sp.]|nr:exonuclease domain-containing protein [Eubacterium sp.]MDY6045744.1 3'-5' exonuclease [Anaerobutyricum sp.]